MDRNIDTLRVPLWLWTPLAASVCQIVLEITLRKHMLRWWVSEEGPLELLQFAILMAALAVALATAGQPGLKGRPWLKAWLVIAAICCFYVGGEEISWGQWFFHWQTPSAWAQINNQNETNLHNTSSWLDQKPRLLLEIGVLIGGLVIPLLRHYRPGLLPARFQAIYPPAILAITAGCYAFFKITSSFGHFVLHVHLYERVAEVTETFMYWFTLLYLLVMRRRVKAMAAITATGR